MSIFGAQAGAPQSAFASAPTLFGAPAQSGASLFGAPAQSSASLFGAPAQSSASLFGAPAQSSASLFGAPAQSNASLFGAPAQSGASLFGAPAQSGASLFGAPAQSNASLFGAPAQSGASLFGAPAQSSASLFGAPAQSNASLFGAPAQSSASLFGAPAQSSASLFGAPAQSSASLFGAPAQSAPSLFGSTVQQSGGGGLWGVQGGVAQPAPAPNAQEAAVEITGRTRIFRLPQNLQTDLFAVERHLREQRMKASKLWAKRRDMEADISQVQVRSANVSRRLVKLRAGLESLKANADSLKAAVRTERGFAEPVLLALDNLTQHHDSMEVGFLQSGNGFRPGIGSLRGHDRNAHVPDEYFARVVNELEARANEYKGEIDEIAEYLRAQGVVLSSNSGSLGRGKQRTQGSAVSGLLDSLSQRHTDMGVSESDPSVASKGKTIEEVIRRQYEYFMVVASHIAGVYENLRTVREQFLHIRRRWDSDALDPFEQADLREKAEKERQRLTADKLASDNSVSFDAPVSQAAPQPLTTAAGFGASLGGGGGSGGGTGQTGGLFGNVSGGGSGFGSALNGGSTDQGVNGGQNRRTSAGRRKRS